MDGKSRKKLIGKAFQELLLILLGGILLFAAQNAVDPANTISAKVRHIDPGLFGHAFTSSIYLAVAFFIFALRRMKDLRRKVGRLRRTEKLLRQEHDFLQELIDVIPNPVFYKDTDGRYRICNRAFQLAFGLKRKQIIGKTIFDFAAPGVAERCARTDREIFVDGRDIVYESRVEFGDGEQHDIMFTKALHVENGIPSGIVGVMTDISGMKHLELQLRESEALFRTLAQSSLIGVALYDGGFIYINSTLEQITGYTHGELLGMHPWDILHPESKDQLRPLVVVLLKEKSFSAVRVEGRIVTKDGRARWIQCYAETVDYHGRRVVLGNFIDITEKKELEEKMKFMATFDKLTQVYNRSRLDEILSAEIARVRRYEHPLTIVMIDIDHFKSVNDTYGHITGDAVLAEFARIIHHSIRRTDSVGRWGGEEFMLILPETPLAAAYELAEKLRKIVMTYPFDTVDSVTASFGVAEFLPEETNFDLLKRADDALYRAKRQRNTVEVAEPSECVRQFALPLG